jgi:4-aminobutyrate aminotransferase
MQATTLSRALFDRDRVIASSNKFRLYPFALGRTEGTRVYDLDGREYYDWEGSVCVAATGYRHPHVRAAIQRTLDTEYSHLLAIYPSEPAVSLAERLIELTPGTFEKKVWFGSSGSDALDCLVKLLPRTPGRPRLVSYIGAHHGLTVGAGLISGEGIQARFLNAGHITKAPYPYPYRCAWGPCDPEACSLKCLSFLEDEILHGISPPEETAAIFFEPVQSFGGEIVPPRNYPPALRELCDRYGIHLVVDEVKTGLGRTGRMWAADHWGIVPDAVTLGKPLGGGLPLSAVVARSEILEGQPVTAQALSGSPAPCAAALAVLEVIEQEELAKNAEAIGLQLLNGLRDVQARSRLIGEVRGLGMILGVELVQDRVSRAPAKLDTLRLCYRLYELGLLVISVGRYGNVIEITPPLTSTGAEVDAALAIFEEAVADVEAGRFDDANLPLELVRPADAGGLSGA